MSFEVVTWAFRQELYSATDKFVLIALANYVGDTGKCFPSVSTVCAFTSLQEDTVRRSLVSLVECGLITDTGLRAGTTKQIKVYQFPPDSWMIERPPKTGVFRKTGERPVEGTLKTPENRGLPYYTRSGNREPGSSPHCSDFEITIEHVLNWLSQWKTSGADYTEEEAKSAYLAMQASGWMWGKNPVHDPRAAIERQIQTDRKNNTSRNGNGALPAWRQLEALDEQISQHVANPQSAYHNKNCTEADRADLRSKRIKLRELKNDK